MAILNTSLQDDLQVNLIASLSGYKTPGDYIKDHKDALDALPGLEKAANQLIVNDLGDYQRGMKLFNVLNSLICYVWNNRIDDKETSKVYSIAWKKLYQFCKGYNVIKGVIGSYGRYLCWTRHYSHEEKEVLYIINALQGHIWKKNGQYCLTGLHLATGDNTFTVSRQGGEYRNYNKTLGLQAIWINSYWNEWLTTFEKSNKIEIFELPDYYETVSTGNYKYAVKPTVSRKDKTAILDSLKGV